MSKGRPLKSARVPQVCVVPFRHFGDGTAFCLITSLRKRRWIFPKGTINGGESLQEAALKEAHEEAGLHGRIVGPPLGRYLDSKRGTVLDVTVLLMEVERSDDVWEEDARLRCWMDGRGALRLLDKPQLRTMLRRGIRQLSPADGRVRRGSTSDKVGAELLPVPAL